MTSTAEQLGPPTLAKLMDRFARARVTDQWVVSCYLKLEPRDRARGKYLIKLKNRIKERLNWLEEVGVSRAERDVVEGDLRRVREYLEDPTNLPTGRGIVIFACGPLQLFEVIPLPQVFRSRLAIDHSPLVRELAALDDEFGLVQCAVYDRTSARFFRVTALGAEELTGLTAGERTRAGRFHGARSVSGPGPTVASAGEHNFHRRIEKEKDRHYAEVAERLFELSRLQPLRGIVLAGNGTDGNAVVPHLHPYLRKGLLGTAKLNPKTASLAEVVEAVWSVRRRSEREWELQHMAELRDGVGTGWAVNGVDDTLAALARGQVRTLLVNPTAAYPGYRCQESGRLTSAADGCSGEGDPDAVPDVVEEAIEEALRQGAHIDVVEDEAARESVLGLAALLRFTS